MTNKNPNVPRHSIFHEIAERMRCGENPYSEKPALSPGAVILAACILGGMLILVFGDLIFFPGDLVISKRGADIYLGGLLGREFTFEQLRHGNFMLWCPLSFCGYPSFGGFQSGLLYPLNFIYLLLPVVQAINWQFVIHVFMGGMFMYLWLGNRGLHRYACLAGAMMFAFCAPFYMRLYVGHLAPHSTISWIPLVFLAIDGIIARPSLGWFLLGSGAVSMGLLGGYPQIWFYTGITAAIYGAVRCFEAPRLRDTLLCLVGINIMALGLTCVQWAAGFTMSQECVRAGGVPFKFAASLSLPPESWLTLLRPGLMGDMQSFPYWGRWYLWEMCPYFGIAGFFFAIVGLKHSKRSNVLLAAGLILMTGILAMGVNTPFFPVLYSYVPGFNMFRSNSKFIILTVVFLIYLSAHGIDWLARAPQVWRGLWLGGVISCLVLIVACALAYWDIGNIIGGLMRICALSYESYYPPGGFSIPSVVDLAAKFAARELLVAIGVMSILTLLLILARKSSSFRFWLLPAVVSLIGLELLMFGWQERETFNSKIVKQEDLRNFLQPRIGEFRIFSVDCATDALATLVPDIWGYGSDSVNRRYAQFMAFTQGDDPDKVTGYQSFKRMHPRFDMLRCKFIISSIGGQKEITELPKPMPRFLLLSDWSVVTNRDAIFAEIGKSSFDPWKTVLLERAPAAEWVSAAASNPAISGVPGSQIRILRETTNWLELEVDLPHPGLLLQTDIYSPSWHVRALPGSSQSSYELLPGNYVLRTIPLNAGRHLLRIEYAPKAFVIGKWISIISLLIYVCAMGWWFRRYRKMRMPSLKHN